MITLADLSADALGAFLAADFRRNFGSTHVEYAEVIDSVARLAIECIANSDALYHNLEHTMLVTLAGRDILAGRALRESTSPADWTHFLVACLMHDIGYVRGVLNGDEMDRFLVDGEGKMVSLSRGASDAGLAPWHVDRSKRFVLDRFGASKVLDAERIARMIEFTRFPTEVGRNDGELDAETGLVRAADLIGQLGDPHYLRKTVALFYEFAETGVNERLGYDSPADIVERYPAFFWEHVADQISPAIRHLNVTVEGRRWIAHLHANVFGAERNLRLAGPQT
jgi:hypothetical protein